MLQNLSTASTGSLNDILYSNWCPIFTLILLFVRVIIVIFHRRLYARPVIVSMFVTAKFLMDYLMFEGVERFSIFSEHLNLQIISAIEIFYVIMSNFMIYSIFYADFMLPTKVITQFCVLNLVSVIVAMVLLIVVENLMCYLTTIMTLHAISMILYLDKSLALIKCGIYNSVGKTFIYISIVFKIMLDHFIRIFYISNLLYNFLISSVIQDRCLYIIQLCSTFLLVFIFIFYRRHNSENIGPVFMAAKKTKSDGVKSTKFEFVFENIAEELMFPSENELNTISDVGSECDLDIDDDLPNVPEEHPGLEVASISQVVSSPDPTIFATAESGLPRRHEHRFQILRRTLNKVSSADGHSSGNR